MWFPCQGEIESTNPCGEQPLLPYESCNLGSINLVQNACKKRRKAMPWITDLLRDTVRQAVHFLDNVIDVNNYPLEQIGAVTTGHTQNRPGRDGLCRYAAVSGGALQFRRGRCVGGEADGLYQRRRGTRPVLRWRAQRGAFPLFAESIYKDGDPLRNGTVTTIAPTGTLSMIARLLLRRGACVCLCVYPQHHGRYGDAGGKPGAAGRAAGARTVLATL